VAIIPTVNRATRTTHDNHQFAIDRVVREMKEEMREITGTKLLVAKGVRGAARTRPLPLSRPRSSPSWHAKLPSGTSLQCSNDGTHPGADWLPFSSTPSVRRPSYFYFYF